MVICPDCKKDVPEAKFCKNCGAYIQNETDNNPQFKKCPKCGYNIFGDFKYCPGCGYGLKVADKSLFTAIILSVLLPGLGQIYLKLDRKGSIFLISYIISALLILIAVGLILCPIIWIWALIDSISSCNKINKGEEVEDKIL